METVLITGANRGLGLALVQEMLTLGYDVIATARDVSRAADLLALQEKNPSRVRVVSLEVNSDVSVAELATEIPNLDILVNNAAVFPEEGNEKVAEWQASHLTDAFETNVVGVMRVTQALLPALKKSFAARVVNISSTAGSISGKHTSDFYAYSTSKAALNMLTRAMAFDLSSSGITVVPVHPGWVQTDMGGPGATLTPTESASAIANLIKNLKPDQAGQFLERDGTPCRLAW